MFCICGAEIPDGQQYCGQCGSRVDADTLEGLRLRIHTLQQQLDKISSEKKIEQRFIEIDTAEKVVNRITTWGKLLGYWVGIPLGIIVIGISLFLGKTFKDLNDIATTAHDSITPILDRARSDAKQAQAIASGALQTSNDVKRSVEEIQQQVGSLRIEAMKRTSEVKHLNDEIQKAKVDLTGFRATVAAQTKEVKHLRQQVQAVMSEKNVASVRDAYPEIFGERVASSRQGFIDVAKKTPQDIYVSLSLHGTGTQRRLDDKKIADVMGSLSERKYTVFLGGVALHATSGRSSSGVGPQLAEDSCRIAGIQNPPCILYFRQQHKSTAVDVRDLARPVQNISEDRIRYVDPTKTESTMQELLKKSGVDIVVVLSG